MSALLDERQKRRRDLRNEQPEGAGAKTAAEEVGSKSLQSLAASVKRKSANIDPPGLGKRKKAIIIAFGLTSTSFFLFS